MTHYPIKPISRIVTAVAIATITSATAQTQTIEQVAQAIAAQHNQNASTMLDEMTASSKATATGKNIQFSNVLRIKQGLSKVKLQEFDNANRKEIIPRVCSVKGNQIGFKRGLTYTFLYTNTYGEKLSEFTVDTKTCGITQ